MQALITPIHPCPEGQGFLGKLDKTFMIDHRKIIILPRNQKSEG